MHTKIKELLNLAIANKASDIHLAVGILPKLRVNGQLVDIGNFDVSDNSLMSEMILSILNTKQKERLLVEREIDFPVSLEENRFRANMFYQRGEVACSLRMVLSEIPTFSDLNLPEIFNSFVDYKQGFVLVTGPTGQGKSTTVASILNEINLKQANHIITIEDPIEYIIKPKKSIISQREVGQDTNTFDKALRSCLRQDPNVVFLGEMRDLETISTALTVAETGHLVFSTLHTNSASQTIDRIIDAFPENTKDQVRVQLSSVITAIVSQRLVPGLDGGRVPAFEILIATPAVRNNIREGKSFMIDNIIQTSSDVGMMSLESSLSLLVRQRKISEETALNYSLKPSELQGRLRKGL
jgi:twitching motility protein PilT